VSFQLLNYFMAIRTDLWSSDLFIKSYHDYLLNLRTTYNSGIRTKNNANRLNHFYTNIHAVKHICCLVNKIRVWANVNNKNHSYLAL
jgi:hypothetical protein